MRPDPGRSAAGAVDYDAELQRHDVVLSRVADVRVHEHVLDIGCGSGPTTRRAAVRASAGSALGVDVSASAIERAGRAARAQGLCNVTFEQADAQTHTFAQGHFDLVISRFGTMFFDDPIAAFTNIGQALRPGGRLAMTVWQSSDRNAWDVAIRQALTSGPEPTGGAEGTANSPSRGRDPFSLAEPPRVEQILQTSGFADVRFVDVREPVYYGPDVDTALAWVCGFTSTSEALERLDPTATTEARERLRSALRARLGDDGVWFDSRAWIVTAHR